MFCVNEFLTVGAEFRVQQKLFPNSFFFFKFNFTHYQRRSKPYLLSKVNPFPKKNIIRIRLRGGRFLFTHFNEKWFYTRIFSKKYKLKLHFIATLSIVHLWPAASLKLDREERGQNIYLTKHALIKYLLSRKNCSLVIVKDPLYVAQVLQFVRCFL